MFLPIMIGFLDRGLTVIVDQSTLAPTPLEMVRNKRKKTLPDVKIDPQELFGDAALESFRYKSCGTDFEVYRKTIIKPAPYWRGRQPPQVKVIYIFQKKD